MGEEVETPLAVAEVDVETQEEPKAEFDDVVTKEVVKGKNFASWEPDETDPPMRETVLNLGERFGSLKFNHVASFIGIAVLWGVATWCMVDNVNARTELIEWRGKSAQYFTWFYIGTGPLWLFFVIYLAIRFGDVKLGPNDSKPEFNDIEYFTMLFASGIGVGLFFYGVSEPLWHQDSHWFAESKYRTQDEIDQFAINQTLWHWGPIGWGGYVLVALAVGVSAYRFNLPLTLRSTLYPILGKYTWGWIGDFIDGFTIVVTVSGVCTSLGLGAMQILAGLQRIKFVDAVLTDNKENDILIAIIWVITLVATASVVSGLDVGIKHLSNLAFILGQILLMWAFISDQTAYLLNLIVQSFGYFLHYGTFINNFWTDAFGQLRPGEGRAIDEQAAATWWMDAWAVFYMAWWTAWSGFVGLFVARISKGRTVREVVVFGLIIPFSYVILWFCIFGGIGIRQARVALELRELGQTLYNDTGFFLAPGSDYCYDVPQNGHMFNGSMVFETVVEGVTPVCEFKSSEDTQAWFNVLFSFSFPNDFNIGFGHFFSVVSLIAISIYFVTSSDSGSLVVDTLASNGHEEHHWLQRVFWAFTEGAVASALLVAGQSDSLRALQAASILAGLPFTIIMCYMMQSLWVFCTYAEENPDKTTFEFDDGVHGRDFATPIFGGIFNIFEFLFSLGAVHPRRIELGLGVPQTNHISGFFINLLFPFVGLYSVLSKDKPSQPVSNMILTTIYAVLHLMWIALFISTIASHGLRIFAWTAFFTNGLILCGVKHSFRTKHNLRGYFVGDFLSGMFAYPQVLVQLNEEATELGLPYDTEK